MSRAQNLLTLVEKAGASKSYLLLFEVRHPYFNPFLHQRLFENIKKKLVKEIDHGDWIERTELWSMYGDDETEMHSAYTPTGDYIGNVDDAKALLKKGITQFEKTDPVNNSVVSIGFNPEEQKWYGWSHRAMYGFGVGSKVKKGDCAYCPMDSDDLARDMRAFWIDSKREKDFSNIVIKKDGADPETGKGKGIFISYDCKKKGGGTFHNQHWEPYLDPWGHGEWTAETLDDAKQMAIDFAKGVS